MGATSDRSKGYKGTGTNTTGYLKPFAGSNGSSLIWSFAVFGYGYTESGRTTTDRTNPVGSKSPNELGLYDMSGNVFEWIWGGNYLYPKGTKTDYRNPTKDAGGRCRRGGYYWHDASYCSVQNRDFYPMKDLGSAVQVSGLSAHEA